MAPNHTGLKIMANASIKDIKGVTGKPDSMGGNTKAAMNAGQPKRLAMANTLPKGGNAMPKVK
jgi:hypothetical protein